jgi:superfamily II DNA or RNA helicase
MQRGNVVITPRDYQSDVVEKIREQLRKGFRKILVTLPTGSGKSIIMGIISKLCIDNRKRVLALMHRRQLVMQLQDRFESCEVESSLLMAGEGSNLNSMCQIGTIQTYSRRIQIEENTVFGETESPWFINADVVFIDECLDPETEILTESGWTLIKNLKHEKVAQFDADSHKVDFVVPEKIVKKEYTGKMYKFKNTHVDIVGTGNHLQLVKKLKSTRKEPFEGWRPNGSQKIFCAGFGSGKKQLTFLDRFKIALAADGCIIKKKPRGRQIIQFQFSKERKIDRLLKIISHCKFEFKEVKSTPENGNTNKKRRFQVYVPDGLWSKNLRDIIHLEDISKDYAVDFIKELVLWDGYTKGVTYWSGTNGKDADFIQALCALGGIWSSHNIQKDSRKETYKDVHRMCFKFTNTKSCQTIKKSKYNYHGNVYCVRVPSGNIIIRRNNRVSITGNCHRSLSKTFQDTLEKYQDKIVIGFTATPSLSSGVAMGNYYESLVQPVSVKQLIEAGALVPGVYYGLSTPDLDKIRMVAGDYDKKELGEAVEDHKIIGDIVTNWLKIANNKKTIVFAVNVKHSVAICREFQKYDITAEHLDSYSSDEEREEVLNRFRSGEVRVLCNVDLYTEGTDIPDIECVCLARPTKSIGRYIQMVGRGARPFHNKDNFIVLDHGANVNEHGFYEDDTYWSLEGKKIAHYKAIRNVKEKHKMTCKECDCIFTGKQCPECMTEIPNYGKKIEALEAELKSLNKDDKKFTLKDKQQWYGMFMYIQRQKGYNPGWVAHKYREKIGCWPRNMGGVDAIKPSTEFNNYMKHLRIKWIKQKQKREKMEAAVG